MPSIKIIKALLVSIVTILSPTVSAQITLESGTNLSDLFEGSLTVVDGVIVAEGDMLIRHVNSVDKSPSTVSQALLGHNLFSNTASDVNTWVSSSEQRGVQVQDIALEKGSAQRGIGLGSSVGLWKNGVVPYTMSTDLSEDVRTSVLLAIAHWNEASSISIVDRKTLPSGTAPDYVEFVNGTGCASWVGRQGGPQSIWVSSSCNAGSVIHEIGHALGLLHEHTRADRDQYIQVNLQNVQQDKEFNFDIVDAGEGAVLLGEYDYSSIMHYGEYFFTSNGQPTLVPFGTAGNVSIGQRSATSAGDRAAIDQLYGTDLELVTQLHEDTENQTTQVSLFVTNEGARGAHNLKLVLSVELQSTAYSSDGQWVCHQTEIDVTCTATALNAGRSSSLILDFAGLSGVAEAQILSRIGIGSKTHDNNLDNNGIYVDMNFEPVLGQALTEDSANVVASAGGGGSLGVMILLLPLLVAGKKRH